MFGMSAERNGVERTPRIDSGGTPPLRSLCTRKKALKAATVTKVAGNRTESLGQAFLKGAVPALSVHVIVRSAGAPLTLHS